MRRILAAMVAVSLVAAGVPGTVMSLTTTVSAMGQGPAAISGVVVDCRESAVANARVRLRDTTANELVAETKTNSQGQFSFAGVASGRYLAEVVSSGRGGVLASSQPLAAAGAAVTNAQIRIAEGCSGGFFTSTGGVLTMAAIAAGITVGAIAVGDGGSTNLRPPALVTSAPTATATPAAAVEAAAAPAPTSVTPASVPTSPATPGPASTTIGGGGEPQHPTTPTTPACNPQFHNCTPFQPTPPCNPQFHNCNVPCNPQFHDCGQPPASPHS